MRTIQKRRSTQPKSQTFAQTSNDPIKVLLDHLSEQTGAIAFGNGDEPRYLPVVPASTITVNFSNAVPSPVVSTNVLANMAFKSDTLRAAVYKASAYLNAGVQMAVIDDPTDALAGREILSARNTFCSSEPLKYEILADGEELTEQPLPFEFQTFKIADDASVGATFTITRRQLKDTPQHALHGLMLDAIAGGIGKAVDTRIATHLAGLELGQFTLAKAAARGLSMADLVGVTDGTSEAVALDRGELFLKGISAELCQAEGSYILAAGKFAVAVPQEVRITAVRQKNGSVEITIWTNIEVLATDHSNTAAWVA
ncbi:hypothetical protein FSC12_01840 [Acinetobacter schindleri]|uniref:hypothetical protein n=1 Tax=Acinetobacter schindleri TaxID=108981 RepID=UPI0013B0822F|nr:hypothetical protein [Acinetobacter schindleri]QIC60178.1 hypothetical protein FSC12_01840 [Acinetobacter schindleri]